MRTKIPNCPKGSLQGPARTSILLAPLQRRGGQDGSVDVSAAAAPGPRALRARRGSRDHLRPRRVQEEGRASSSAAHRRSGARHPEGRAGLRGVDRVARRLRQRRDPPADRGLRAPTDLPRGLPRQGRRGPLRDRSPRSSRRPTTRPRAALAQYEATLANAKTTVARYTASGRAEGDQPAGAGRRRDARANGAGQRGDALGRASRRRSWTSTGRRSSRRSTASRASRSPRSATSSTVRSS